MDNIFVILPSKNLLESLEYLRLFPQRTNTNIAWQVVSFLFAISLLCRSFVAKFITNSYFKLLLGHHEEWMGLMAASVWITIGFSVTEIITFRLWMAYEYLYIRVQQKSASFFVLFDHIPNDLHQFLLKIAKHNYITLTVVLDFLFIIMELLQLVKTEDVIEFVSQAIWFAFTMYYTRYMATELSTIFVVGFAMYKTIDLKCHDLITTVVDYDEKIRSSLNNKRIADRWKVSFGKIIIHADLEIEFLTRIMTQYVSIVNSIVSFKRLALLLLLASDILVVPAFSSTIYNFTLHPHNFLEVLLKQSAISTSVLFFSRSYIVTAVFAGVHAKSKKLHTLLASLLARRALSPHFKVLVLELLESLASPRNCMAIPQSGELFVKQIDTMFNLLNTVQFVLLMFDFRRLFD